MVPVWPWVRLGDIPMIRPDRRSFLSGSAALAASMLGPGSLVARRADAASYMTPATAVAAFAHETSKTILRPSFSELLWYTDDSGRCRLHLEWSTPQFQNYGRPGRFVKGGAKGIFYVSFASGLAPTSPRFWWPPGSVSQQPPPKLGQNMWGEVHTCTGINPAALPPGYDQIMPHVGDGAVTFMLSGIGKPRLLLTADHFNESGPLEIYADFSYMIGQ